MSPDDSKIRRRSRSTLSLLLLGTMLLVVGCGGYVLEGRAVSGDYSSVELVDPDDPRLDLPGLGGVTIELIRDPESLGKRVVGRSNSQGNGSVRLSVGDFGVGFLEEDWDIRVLNRGAECAVARLSLPFDPTSRRLLVIVRKGDGRERNSLGIEAERILQQEERQVPRDSVIFR